MRTTVKKALFAVLPLAGLLFLPPVASAHDKDRHEYRHDQRQVHREFHRDQKRAHREFHRDLKHARRDYRRDRHDHDRRAYYRNRYYRGRYSDDRYYPRPFSSGYPRWYNWGYR